MTKILLFFSAIYLFNQNEPLIAALLCYVCFVKDFKDD